MGEVIIEGVTQPTPIVKVKDNIAPNIRQRVLHIKTKIGRYSQTYGRFREEIYQRNQKGTENSNNDGVPTDENDSSLLEEKRAYWEVLLKLASQKNRRLLSIIAKRLLKNNYFVEKHLAQLCEYLGIKDYEKIKDLRGVLIFKITLGLQKCDLQQMPDTLFEAMNKAYEQELSEQVRVHNEIFPELMEDVRGSLLKAITEGKLPIEPSRVDQVLSTVSYRLIDEAITRLLDISGQYSSETLEIELSNHLLEDNDWILSLIGTEPEQPPTEEQQRRARELINFLGTISAKVRSALRSHVLETANFKHILIHEIIHALSGITIIETKRVGNSSPEVTHWRLGLGFHKTKKDKPENESKSEKKESEKEDKKLTGDFRWLNEAVTEYLTLSVLEEADVGIYKNERKLLELLTQKVPMELFIKAYCEDFDPDLPPGQRISAWRTLQKAFHDAYGPRFLVRLSHFIFEYKRSKEDTSFINKGGVKAAISYIERGDFSFL